MNFLYAITIYPLEILFRFAYLSCVSITGSYGLSLIALSLLVACAYVPLHKVVNKAQEKENAIQDEMTPQIVAIKEKYDGAKRHEAIMRLYRRYGYHPIMAIRSAFGILLQVPFLMAAYYMVAGLSVLNGQSFLFIKDLAKPDALLFGINLLPIVMTGLNVVTTFLTPNMKLKERVQALVLAGLFLWLLYPAPSALLFYWTCNNTIYLIEALFAIFCKKRKEIFKGIKPRKKIFACNKRFTLGKTRVARLRRVFGVTVCALLVVFFLLLAKIFYYVTLHADTSILQATLTYIYFYQLLVVLALIIGILFAHQLIHTAAINGKKRQEITKHLLFLVLNVVFFITIIEIMLLKYRNNDILIDFEDKKFIVSAILPFVYCSCLVILAISDKICNKLFDSSFAKNSGILYFASIMSFTSVFFIYCPATLYSSDKTFFHQNFGTLMFTLLPVSLIFLIIMATLYLVLSKKNRIILSFITIAIVTFSLLVCFVFTVDYGALDISVLQNETILYSPIILLQDLFAVFVTVAFLFLLLHWKTVPKYANIVFLSIFLATIFCSAFITMSTKENVEQKSIKIGDNLLPPYHTQLWRLSKTEKNVVVFFFDMFTGGHIRDIIEIEPAIAKSLDGFVWYPDTLATGDATVQSTPSLYGGGDFSPSELDKNKNGESIYCKINQAYYLLPNEFEKHGYDVAIGGLPYSNAEQCKKHSTASDALILFSEIWGNDYVSFWNKRMKEEISMDLVTVVDIRQIWRKYFAVFSSFRMLPHTFRALLYQNGNWHDSLKDMHGQQIDMTIQRLAPLQFMADFVNTNAKRPTFKFYQSTLSHHPWHLRQNSLVPVANPCSKMKPNTGNIGGYTLIDGRIPEHFFTEQHMIHFIVKYCEKLKKLGCYDNTRIVIVSDHCAGDSAMINTIFTGDKNTPASLGRPHGLMLVKDFNSRGVLKTDWSLVSSMDTPSFVLNDLFEVKGIPNKNCISKIIHNPKRLRKYYRVANWRPEEQRSTSFIYSSIYEVTGTMFKKENWRKVR